MADKKSWIIAYDITEPSRLRRVHKYLSKRAFALQYSVFAADLDHRELAVMKQALLKLIDGEEDDLRFYAAPLDLRMFGARRLPEGVYVFDKGAAGLTNAPHVAAQNVPPLKEGND
jgi:CRISPR-associated protein Cas2